MKKRTEKDDNDHYNDDYNMMNLRYRENKKKNGSSW